MGNDNISAYQYLTQYKFTNGMIFGNDLDVNKTLNMTRTANPNVTWETAKTFNLGFSSQFLNGKFGLDFDYFHSKKNRYLNTTLCISSLVHRFKLTCRKFR